MKLLITGAAGFVGSLLARTLLRRESLAGEKLEKLVLADQALPLPDLSRDERVEWRTGDLLQMAAALGEERFDGAFHLAAAVSGECEADLELGLHANLDAGRALFDSLRRAGNAPRVVFASSAAVFGGDPPRSSAPSVVRDDTWPTPQTSYGTQKLLLEQLLSDYSRKGVLDGRALRLLTVSVRPGRPNAAASGFLSGMVREPLAGKSSICPVPLDTRVALASPARTVAALLRVYECSREEFGASTALNLPSLTVSIGQMLDALEVVAGPEARALVRLQSDATIERIVQTWPGRFEAQRAERLGLQPDPDFESVIRAYARDHADAVQLSVID